LAEEDLVNYGGIACEGIKTRNFELALNPAPRKHHFLPKLVKKVPKSISKSHQRYSSVDKLRSPTMNRGIVSRINLGIQEELSDENNSSI
jgi:hypothetical protein